MNTQTKIAAVPKEDGIRELHGCVAVESDGKGKRLMLLEQATFVTLGWDYHEVRITPPQCRYLAERLYSLAARVERRL